MPRFTNPRPQFSDKNGSPYAFGSLTFYETGTTTFKTTYLDPGLTTPNPNPIPLDMAGRAQVDIFFDGDARVLLKDSNNVLVWDEDPVSLSTSTTFPEWNGATTYQPFDVVRYQDNYYRAIATSTNELPTNQMFWSKLLQTEEWNPNDTYDTDDLVVRGGIHYISLIDSNTSDPDVNKTNWRASSSATVIYEDTGSSSSYIISAKSGFSNQLLEDGLVLNFVASNDSDDNAVLNYNSTGNKNIVLSDGTAVKSGQIKESENITVFYLSSSDSWVLTGGSASNSIRYSKLDNPVLNIFKNNNLESVINGSITWTRSTTGTYETRSGLIASAAINTPREEPDGWLIEGESTNIILYSDQFDNAAWANLRSSVTADSTTSPDGTVNADTITEDNNNNTHSQRQSISVTSGTSYTASAFAKTNGRNFGFEFRSSSFGARSRVVFNLTTGQTSVVEGSFEQVTIKEIADGWYRCTATKTATATETTFSVEFNTVSGGAFFYQGDGTSGVFLWGGQVEALPHVSSYIPTVASTVTRGADLVSIPADGNISPSKLSLYCRQRVNIGLTDANLIEIPGTSGSFFTEGVDSLGNLNKTEISGLTTNDSTLVANDNNVHDVVVINNSESKDLVDGFTSYTRTGTSTFSFDPTGDIDLGNDSAGTKPFYGNIRDLRIYDFELTPSEIEFLGGQ